MRTALNTPIADDPVVFRAARTRELAELDRLIPDLGGFDRTLVAEGRIRVLSRAGLVLGAIGWVEHGAGRVALRTWAVVPMERGRGRGRDLLDAALAELAVAGHRWVDVDAPAATVPWLVRCGFRAFGPAPFFVDGRPLAGVWMTRGVARPVGAIV